MYKTGSFEKLTLVYGIGHGIDIDATTKQIVVNMRAGLIAAGECLSSWCIMIALTRDDADDGKHHTLHYGRSTKVLASVLCDPVWPDMFRVHWPDGTISDLVNLTRARDAAEMICERGPPRLDPKLFRWCAIERLRDAEPSSPVRQTHDEGVK